MVSYEQLLDRDLDWALREGSMHFEGRSAVHKTLRRIAQHTLRSIAQWLDELSVEYAIAGGMSLFFHGYRRVTDSISCCSNFSKKKSEHLLVEWCPHKVKHLVAGCTR